MSRILIGICSLVILAGALVAAGTGWGKVVTASTTSQRVDGFTAANVSVYNNGTNDVFVLVNCTTNVFDARFLSGTGTAIRVKSATSFVFDTDSSSAIDSIDSLCLATVAGESEVFIGAY